MRHLDVIIPCYRYARFLRACAESVLTQEGVAVRVLILDDASPDHTAEVACELAAQDDRVEFRRHAVNQGHIATYNEGIDWATGDYLLVVSADDLLTPGALARAVRLLDARPEVGMVYGRQILFRSDAPPAAPAPPDAVGFEVVAGHAFLEACCAQGANPVSAPTAVVRAALQKQLGGYRQELPHTADLEMWLRFAAHADVGVIPADQAFKRAHGHNMQLQFTGPAAVEELRQRRAAFELFFRNRGNQLRDRERLEQMAGSSLAEQAFWMASRAFDEGDVDRCEQLLRFTLALRPEWRNRREWSRLRWKRLAGPFVWRFFRPVITELRQRLRARSVPTARLRERASAGRLLAAAGLLSGFCPRPPFS